ncbi:hypothetical protein [Streptomyces avermitilis]|uniref:hypothetical protein n=1 Tax=Streptomyces avermitilis TaxID=33903 RepID=UPI0033ACAECF
MSVGLPRRKRPARCRSAPVTLAGLVAAAAMGTASLVSCGTDGGGSNNASSSPTPTAPDTASFSGTPPSALSSLGASVKESARAAASAAASSASAAASAFEASVSADVARANAAAEKRLKNAKGQGNAMSDVSLTGKPRSETGGVLALVVNITNSTDKTASYAVQVDFRDPDGKAQPLAISRKPPEPRLTAEIARAQRY